MIHSPRRDLAEVWGETVSLAHLAAAVVIAVPLTLGGFTVGGWLLARATGDAETARTYSLLIGLALVVVSGALCAVLFRPQRRVNLGASDVTDTAFEDTLKDYHATEGLGRVGDLPEDVQEELRHLELFEAFEAAERRLVGSADDLESGDMPATDAVPAVSAVPSGQGTSQPGASRVDTGRAAR